MVMPRAAEPAGGDEGEQPRAGAAAAGAPVANSGPGAGIVGAESRDPATGLVWRRYPPPSPDEVRSALDAARRAQPAWRALPLADRVRMVRRFHDVLHRRRLEVAETIAKENGKPIAEAIVTEIVTALDMAHFLAREAPRVLAPRVVRSRSLAMIGRKRIRIEREPFGVVAVISPWNYPFLLAAGVVLPALVAGNAVVLKPSELTPTCGVLLVELLHEAGVPEEIVTALPGGAAAGAALVSAGPDKVFFTGSVRSGRAVAVECAQRFVPCALELGGSDAAIVLADADLDVAASGIAWGRFSNAGQTCVAPKRVFVVDAAYDVFVGRLTTAVRALRVGALAEGEGEVGPLIRPSQCAVLEGQLRDALDQGARIAARAEPATAGDGVFAPTVLTDVTPAMRVMREETFGPLLPVARVRDADDAVARANASDFGLSASIWSRDTTRAAALARRLEAGTVVINDAIIAAGMAEVPHGGVKGSGIGRAHGAEGLLECVRTKTIIADRFAGWRQPWWFGYGPRRLENIDAYARLAHGKTLRERLSGIGGTVRMLVGRG